MPKKTALELFEADVREAVEMKWAYAELNDGSPKKIDAQEARVAKRRKALAKRLARVKISIDTEGLPSGTTVAFGPGVTTGKPYGLDAYGLPTR